MQYSNPKIPEGINTSKINPLKEFIVLAGGIIVTTIVVLGFLIMLVDFFADKIPFSWEQNIPVSKIVGESKAQATPAYLQNLTQNIAQQMDLPEGMDITLHYMNDDAVNAFATLSGHIFLFKGLLIKIKSEDELSMVIAHEIAHVKYRHPIRSLSHGAVVSIVLSLIGSSSSDAAGGLLGSSSMLTALHFSRDYEYKSDQAAVNTLIKMYGHAQGAIDLFVLFKQELQSSEPVELFNTHPLTKNRISQVSKIVKQSSVEGNKILTPLPKEFTRWLKEIPNKD